MPSGHPAKDGKGHLTSEPILKSKTLVILPPLGVRLAKLVLPPDGFVAPCWSCNARPKPPQCGRKDRRLSAPPWRGFLADKSTHLMLNALSRAAAAPHGLPLFTAKTAPGLFPPTAIARVAAKRCKEDGLLRVLGDNEKPGREVVALTDKGRSSLLHQASPRQVLEDFVRVLEERRQQADDLVAVARQMSASLDSLRSTVEQLRPLAERPSLNGHAGSITAGTSPAARCAGDIDAHLPHGHAAASGDCPLPELFRRLN